MIENIRIENFKSIQDCRINLGKVNLFIGPNNSGKSNFFAALKFLKDWVNTGEIPQNFEDFCFKKQLPNNDNPKSAVAFTFENDLNVYRVEFYRHNRILRASGIAKFPNVDFKIKGTEGYNANFESYSSGLINTNNYSQGFNLFPHLLTPLKSLKIYSIEVSRLKNAYPTLADERQVAEDGSNLVAFLDNMRDENPEVIRAIERDLNYCIPEFKSLRFKKIVPKADDVLYKIYGEKTFKTVGLNDVYGQTYWANELSEGTLYCLCLLAIIHQPQPPTLLFLEEPEKGIHPRRISEIMNFIFDLAEAKNIQVVVSSHSTQVVDEFEDNLENVFVFDKPEAATIIRNLKTDILDVSNEILREKGIPPLDLSGSLGAHWASGILGGVPKRSFLNV